MSMLPKPEHPKYNLAADTPLNLTFFTLCDISESGSELSVGLRLDDGVTSFSVCLLTPDHYSEEKDAKIVNAFEKFADVLEECNSD
ncbi:hypothetical protein [Caudoviricetes sp.]|nr:hypothetical protein [Caudoviricetes sp.]